MTLLLWLLALLLFGLGTGSASTTGGSAAAVRGCSAKQLAPRVALQGATGSLRGGIVLRNQDGTCVLGRVRVTLVHVAFHDTHELRPSLPLPLRHADEARVPLTWRNWCVEPRARLLVRADRGRLVVIRLHDAPPCLNQGAPTLFTVGPPAFR